MADPVHRPYGAAWVRGAVSDRLCAADLARSRSSPATAAAAARRTPTPNVGVVETDDRGTARAAKRWVPPSPGRGPGGPTAPREPARPFWVDGLCPEIPVALCPPGTAPGAPIPVAPPREMPAPPPPARGRGGTSLLAAPLIGPENCTSGIRRTGTDFPVIATPADPG